MRSLFYTSLLFLCISSCKEKDEPQPKLPNVEINSFTLGKYGTVPIEDSIFIYTYEWSFKVKLLTNPPDATVYFSMSEEESFQPVNQYGLNLHLDKPLRVYATKEGYNDSNVKYLFLYLMNDKWPEQFNYSPQPVSDELTIYYEDKAMGRGEINIYDKITGQKYKTVYFTKDKPTMTITVSVADLLEDPNYIAELVMGKVRRFTGRIIIDR